MIIIFCGIPGCGKTTIARKLVKSLRSVKLSLRAPTFQSGRSNLTIKLFISDRLSPPVYPKFLKLLKANLWKSDFLIFDATFYKQALRDRMIKLARPEKTVVVYVKCSLKTALSRNRKRKPAIPERAVHIMASRFEEPKKADIIIDTEKLTPAQSANKIWNSLSRRLKKKRF